MSVHLSRATECSIVKATQRPCYWQICEWEQRSEEGEKEGEKRQPCIEMEREVVENGELMHNLLCNFFFFYFYGSRLKKVFVDFSCCEKTNIL